MNNSNIILYRPFPHQKMLHDAISLHLNTVERGSEEYQKIFTIVSPRQVGKTMACINELIRFVFVFECGTSIYITPSLGIARKVFSELILAANGLIGTSNSTELIITFINGSRIYFKSAEQGNALRGMTVKKGLLIIDEAAFIQDDVYHNVVSPFVDFHKEITLLVSTPRFKHGFFYDNYVSTLSTPYSINFSDFDLTAIRSKEKLNFIKTQVPAKTFKSEHLGLFLDHESSVFGDFDSCISHSKPPFDEIYFGLDFSTGAGKTLYSRFWKSYIRDLFDRNNRLLTCHVKLSLSDINNGLFDRFGYIENTVWLIDRIQGFNPLSESPTKVTLIRVQDMNNYTGQVY